ncbi:YceD family protein [Silanimonas lenta]|uniref:YceD family protein n=1 Tax=Silanimonas lenta TaxID=265429 RepID=UPI00048FEC91|nr:YceD family protein [Silanimonas lenta]
MSATSLSVVDAWRMVSSRRVFTGRVPLSAFARLAGLLADAEGECRYEIEFGRDPSGQATVDLVAEAELPLACQRTLERFLLPVSVRQRLGLLADESEEGALPPGMEPALVGPEGALHPLDLVEDELILAVPAFPVKPGSTEVEAVWNDPAAAVEDEHPGTHPFAALAALKGRKTLGD